MLLDFLCSAIIVEEKSIFTDGPDDEHLCINFQTNVTISQQKFENNGYAQN